MFIYTHHKHFLHSANPFAEYAAQLIAHTSQEEAEQRYSEQSVDNAKDPPTLCVRRDVPKTCTEDRRKCQDVFT